MPPSTVFRAMERVWPWVWRTYYRDYGLRSLADLWRFHRSEQLFDRQNGVRTEFRTPVAELDYKDKTVAAEARRYRATPPFPVRMGLQQLSQRLGGLSNETMIDYGAGAGRILMLGAEAGVGRAIGLEYAESLVTACNANLVSYKAKFNRPTEFEVIQGDATRYVPPKDARLFYFFHPFNHDAIKRALAHIRLSVREAPRDIYVLTFMPGSFVPPGMERIGYVAGVTTYTNALHPERFLSVDDSAHFGDTA